MKDDSARQSVTVTNPQGFHMRPMAAFVETANRSSCTVTVMRDGIDPVNGKSILALMGLVAVPGTKLTIEVNGAGALQVLEQLVDVFHRNFDDEDMRPAS